MELDAFTSRLGLGQGRIQPMGAPVPSGDHLFVLGEDEPGRSFELDPGDHAEVTQETDLTDVDLVRAALRLRVPKTLPVGLAWEVSILVDGAKAATATCEPGCTRVLSDLAANVSKLAGLHVVGVRLELVAVP
ncbi:MAG: hypothetical protein KC766_24745 [Myxococcales bacterium]|nr:hypothetical protein [Myxococcales bacterium]